MTSHYTTYQGKLNTKVNILLRKDQVDTMEDNKNIQLLKKEI